MGTPSSPPSLLARTVVIAADESDSSLSSAQWACVNLIRPNDSVHLVGVVSRVSFSTAIHPGVPMSTAGEMAAMQAGYQEEYAEEEERCKAVLQHARTIMGANGCKEVHAHSIPPTGGASGVGESLVAWSRKENADMLVLGTRGMGAAESVLMSLVGLGSVSSYCLHHLARPVCLVRGPGLLQPRKASNKVMVAVDDSEEAQRAQRWAVDNVLGPQDELHLVCVEPAEVVSLTGVEGVPVTGRTAAGLSAALNTVTAAAEEAAKKVERGRIMYKALKPEGGASTVAKSIKHYAEANGIDLVVVGSRGMGAVKRALHSLVGLGSVSEWCAHNLECPTIITK